MKKILVVTGSRGEWGYLRPILALWNENDAISFDILATNMHLLASHGNTYREIENDGFSIKYKINMAMASDDYYSHSKVEPPNAKSFRHLFKRTLRSSTSVWRQRRTISCCDVCIILLHSSGAYSGGGSLGQH